MAPPIPPFRFVDTPAVTAKPATATLLALIVTLP